MALKWVKGPVSTGTVPGRSWDVGTRPTAALHPKGHMCLRGVLDPTAPSHTLGSAPSPDSSLRWTLLSHGSGGGNTHPRARIRTLCLSGHTVTELVTPGRSEQVGMGQRWFSETLPPTCRSGGVWSLDWLQALQQALLSTTAYVLGNGSLRPAPQLLVQRQQSAA